MARVSLAHDPEIRDGRQPIACPDCGAFLQWAFVGGEAVLRCPWTHDTRYVEDRSTDPTYLYCGHALQGSRVIGGMSVQSVQ